MKFVYGACVWTTLASLCEATIGESTTDECPLMQMAGTLSPRTVPAARQKTAFIGRAPSYTYSPKKTSCTDLGKYQLASEAECELAAATMSLPCRHHMYNNSYNNCMAPGCSVWHKGNGADCSMLCFNPSGRTSDWDDVFEICKDSPTPTVQLGNEDVRNSCAAELYINSDCTGEGVNGNAEQYRAEESEEVRLSEWGRGNANSILFFGEGCKSVEIYDGDECHKGSGDNVKINFKSNIKSGVVLYDVQSAYANRRRGDIQNALTNKGKSSVCVDLPYDLEGDACAINFEVR